MIKIHNVCGKIISVLNINNKYFESLTLHFILFSIASILLMQKMSWYYFRGGDGEYYKHSILANVFFTPNPFTNMAITPHKGMGDITEPLNILLSPPLLSYIYFDSDLLKVIAPYFLLGVFAFLTIYIFSKASNLNKTESIFSAWTAGVLILPFTAYSSTLGIYGVPHVQVFVYSCVIMSIYMYIGSVKSVKNNLILISFFVLSILITVYFAADYAAIGGITTGLFCLGVLLATETTKEMCWKVSSLFMTVIVMLVLRIDEYLLGLSEYSARFFYKDQISYNISNTHLMALFTNSILGKISVLAVLICIFLIIKKDKCVLRNSYGLMAVFIPLLFLCFSLYTHNSWISLKPYQFEYYIFVNYLIIVVFFLLRVLPTYFKKIITSIARIEFKENFLHAFQFFSLVSFTVFLFFYVSTGLIKFKPGEIWSVTHTDITMYLEERLALKFDSQWKGSVVSYIGTDEESGKNRMDKMSEVAKAFNKNGHSDYYLHHFNIPVLESMNHYVTPLFYLFNKSLLRKESSKPIMNYEYFDRYRPRILAAMGVKYIIDDVLKVAPEVKHVMNISSNDSSKNLYLYEINDTNIGNYSPVKLEIMNKYSDIIKRLDQNSFDFKKSVIVAKDIYQTLVPASNTEMIVKREGLHIKSTSKHDSLLVLPVQYSACLKWNNISAKKGDVEILQANLIFTAIHFKDSLNGYLSYEYGINSNRSCRFKDIEQVKRQYI